VRILFTTIPSSGHFHPLVPLARAAAAAGHEVAFAAGASFCPTVEAAGFRCFAAGLDWQGKQLADLFPQARGMAGAELARFFGVDVLVNTEARALVPDLLALARTWPPDLIVRETAQYGGCVAAEALGIPHASVHTNVSTASYGRRHLVADALTALRAAFGLPADPDGTSPFRYLHLAFEPPGFWPPDEPLPPTYHLLRPVPYDRTDLDALPPWVATLPDVPTVCATLGTVSNRATEVFAAILAGLREAGMSLILTVGRNGDPAGFGPQPANVHIERYIPLSLLLPHCDVVISRGASAR
jgi:UDP:flavonoid glycosyltransferase YjiC (YdhE family)